MADDAVSLDGAPVVGVLERLPDECRANGREQDERGQKQEATLPPGSHAQA
jgi:hypothetical protein